MNMPAIGQRIVVRGLNCTIRHILPMGTIEVEADNGLWFRVSGLAFT